MSVDSSTCRLRLHSKYTSWKGGGGVSNWKVTRQIHVGLCPQSSVAAICRSSYSVPSLTPCSPCSQQQRPAPIASCQSLTMIGGLRVALFRTRAAAAMAGAARTHGHASTASACAPPMWTELRGGRSGTTWGWSLPMPGHDVQASSLPPKPDGSPCCAISARALSADNKRPHSHSWPSPVTTADAWEPALTCTMPHIRR